MYATYNTNLKLCGFHKNQPLKNYVELNQDLYMYLLGLQCTQQVYFQNIECGMTITQSNITTQPLKKRPPQLSVADLQTKISELETLVKTVSKQVVALSLGDNNV